MPEFPFAALSFSFLLHCLLNANPILERSCSYDLNGNTAKTFLSKNEATYYKYETQGNKIESIFAEGKTTVNETIKGYVSLSD